MDVNESGGQAKLKDGRINSFLIVREVPISQTINNPVVRVSHSFVKKNSLELSLFLKREKP